MFERLANILVLIGILLVVLAAWMVFPPAGVAIGGVFLILVGVGLMRITRNDRESPE